MKLNKIQRDVAVEDLKWSLEKAEVIFGWASKRGYVADWSEWDSQDFIKFFEMVEWEYNYELPQKAPKPSRRSQKARSRSNHPTARKVG
jgi:hypothetical protein